MRDSCEKLNYATKQVRVNQKEMQDIYLPPKLPEFMIIEETLNIANENLLIPKYYQSFTNLKKKTSKYFRNRI